MSRTPERERIVKYAARDPHESAVFETKENYVKPSIGRIVHFRSRTGQYDVPAMIVATAGQLNPRGVESGGVPPLSSENHVHLLVGTPGMPGLRTSADDFLVESEHPVQENVNGTYQEWDVPFCDVEASADIGSENWDDVPAGSWRWPARV